MTDQHGREHSEGAWALKEGHKPERVHVLQLEDTGFAAFQRLWDPEVDQCQLDQRRAQPASHATHRSVTPHERGGAVDRREITHSTMHDGILRWNHARQPELVHIERVAGPLHQQHAEWRGDDDPEAHRREDLMEAHNQPARGSQGYDRSKGGGSI